VRILIHAVGASMGGGIRHLENLVEALGRTSGGMESRFLVPEGIDTGTQPANIQLETVPRRWTRFAGRLWFDLIRVPRMAKANGCDAVVSLLNFGPIWCPVPHVVFQRNALYFESRGSKGTGFVGRLGLRFRRWLAVQEMRKAALIVTPSAAMRDMILKDVPGLDARKFRTLYHASGDHRPAEPLSREIAERVERSRGARLLYVTHGAAHKGFEELFEALARLKGRGVEFTLFTTAARADWPTGFAAYERRVRELGLEDRVAFLGRIPQEMVPSLCKAANLMVFASHIESFGFPMIEAMENGLPIVAADTPVNQEICGNAALYFPVGDPEATATVISDALEPQMLAQLTRNGALRAAEFPGGWDRYVREFSAIVREAVA
jgi:glycosyltransferase involved in cell wall biosynthesis